MEQGKKSFTTSTGYSPIRNRYDFVLLFDVVYGNPNGDPDAANAPRLDPYTFHGLISDVCLKSKVRKYVELAKEGEPGFSILVKPDRDLNSKYEDAYTAENLKKDQGKNAPANVITAARNYMCRNYYDVRTFGMVMNTGKNWCGKVTGPVQINIAKSISPIEPIEMTITRQAITTEEKSKKAETEMGRKSIVPYGLYRTEGYISPALAQKVTGFSEEDLTLFWESLLNMFEVDHSAARGQMRVRGLYVFKHDSLLGNAPSGDLFDKITVKQTNPEKPARAFSDYEISVDETMPDGVKFIKFI